MRIVAVGCEYSGVTTLIEQIDQWGKSRGIHHHLDDHFTIPDAFHLDAEEQQAMTQMLPAIKERFQRFQIVYHIRVLHRHQHCLLGGFHIEEAVYGPRYYYPGIRVQIREYEQELPDDVILVHLHARADIIRQRMESAPHPVPLVPKADVDEILERFQEEVRLSWISRRFDIDTSDLSPQQLLGAFQERVIPHLDSKDSLIRVLSPE
jgi:hypothetical protein